MKLFSLISSIVLITGGTSANSEKPIAGIVTCKTAPGSKKNEFIALHGNCENTQKACDNYKNDPFYGPATASSCELQYNLTRLKGILMKEFKVNRRFPGSPGSVVLCRTKANGEIFAMAGETCDKEEQKKLCDTYGKAIAEPASSCSIYTSQDWIESEIAKNPLSYGIECQITGSGVPYRVIVPDCSINLKEALCDPTAGKILSCKKWNDPKALKQWAEAIPMSGFVTCRLNDIPTKSVNHIPARDCSPAAQKDACSSWGTPTNCTIKDIEKIRQEQANKQG